VPLVATEAVFDPFPTPYFVVSLVFSLPCPVRGSKTARPVWWEFCPLLSPPILSFLQFVFLDGGGLAFCTRRLLSNVYFSLSSSVPAFVRLRLGFLESTWDVRANNFSISCSFLYLFRSEPRHLSSLERRVC